MKAVLGIPLMANNNILHINTNKTQLAYIFQEEINEKIRKLRIPHLKNYIVPKPEDSLPFFMPIEELPSYLWRGKVVNIISRNFNYRKESMMEAFGVLH